MGVYQLPFTGEEIKKVLDTQYHTPHHDCADNAFTTGSRQAVVGGTEYDFEANCFYENTNLPDHITKLWNSTTNVADFTEEIDTPIYVARVQLTFDPTVSALGFMEFKSYVNETVPVLIQTIRVPYKAVEGRVEALFAFYLGDALGFDVKNKGVIFTYKPDSAGAVWDRGILIYRT